MRQVDCAFLAFLFPCVFDLISREAGVGRCTYFNQYVGFIAGMLRSQISRAKVLADCNVRAGSATTYEAYLRISHCFSSSITIPVS